MSRVDLGNCPCAAHSDLGGSIQSISISLNGAPTATISCPIGERGEGRDTDIHTEPSHGNVRGNWRQEVAIKVSEIAMARDSRVL